MNNSYRIIFSGEIAEGYELSDVKEKLAALLKEDKTKIDRLFSGQTFVIKKDPDKIKCEKIQAMFFGVGAICHIKSPRQSQEHNTKPEPAERSGDNANADLKEAVAGESGETDKRKDAPQQEDDTLIITDSSQQQTSAESKENKKKTQAGKPKEEKKGKPPREKIDLTEKKEKAAAKISEIKKRLSTATSAAREKATEHWHKGTASIKSDMEISGVRLLIKNRYFQSIVGGALFIIIVIGFSLTYERKAMPINKQSIDTVVNHIAFIKKAFTPEEISNLRNNPADFLDYMLVDPIDKMGYQFEESISDLANHYLKGKFSEADQQRIKPLIEILTRERHSLLNNGIISKSLKGKLDNVARKMDGLYPD